MTTLLVIVLSLAAAIGLAFVCTIGMPPVFRKELLSLVGGVFGVVIAICLIGLLPG